VHQMDVAPSYQGPKADHPAPRSTSSEAMDSEPGVPQLPGQGVFVRQEVDDIVIETGSIEIWGGAHQQLLGPASSQPFDQQDHAFQDPTISSYSDR
jgi:hypothetical protein